MLTLPTAACERLYLFLTGAKPDLFCSRGGGGRILLLLYYYYYYNSTTSMMALVRTSPFMNKFLVCNLSVLLNHCIFILFSFFPFT